MAETLDDLTQIYNDVVGIVPPGSPILKDLQAKIAALGVSQAQVTESLIKTQPLITSTSGEVWNEATGTYEKPVSSGGGGGFNLLGIKIGGVVGDFLGEVAEFADDTYDEIRDFAVENKYAIASIALTGGVGTVAGLTAGQSALAATTLTLADGVDKGESLPEAFIKTVATAGLGDLVSGVSDTAAKTIANSINVSEEILKM